MVSSLEETLNAIKDTMGGIPCNSVGSNEVRNKTTMTQRFDSVRTIIGSFYVRMASLVVAATVILMVRDYRKNARTTRWIVRLRRCMIMAGLIVAAGSFILLFGIRLETIPIRIFCIR